LGVSDVDQRRGILLSVQRGASQRRLLAEQAWTDDKGIANAIVLNDYRHWMNEINRLTPGYG
jgi:hypothetical protein